MTSLGLIFVRLLGLWTMVQGVLGIIMFGLTAATTPDWPQPGNWFWLSPGLTVLSGLVVWALAPRIAEKMIGASHGDKTTPQAPGLSIQAVTKSGIWLIALYVLVQDIPDLVLFMPDLFLKNGSVRFELILSIALAVLLMLRAGWFAERIASNVDNE